MNGLIIQHVAGSDPAQFRLMRGKDGKTTEPRPVAPPTTLVDEGRPDSDLMSELAWYLARFHRTDPYEHQARARAVTGALETWGEQAFDQLFGDRAGGGFFNQATGAGYAELLLRISSDDPSVLAWPWEALRDPMAGTLAHLCQIERRVDTVRDPAPVPETLPDARINVLLVTARPLARDVPYLSVARPLVEGITRESLPARVTLLRPPTFARLREHLRERPGYYHILHFDGHGQYGADPARDAGAENGRLLFEDEAGSIDAKTAEQLGPLLREHCIPAVVLNACWSGAITAGAADPFVSVAGALLQAGIRHIVAMAYPLTLDGAQTFLPAFYRRLFETGSFAEATRAGRQQLLARPERQFLGVVHPLDDWVLPVLYQQDPIDFSFAGDAPSDATTRAHQPPSRRLPERLRDADSPYRLVGRNGDVLALERAIHRPPAGLLIHGEDGIGKTALARTFVRWLADTEGVLPENTAWFAFHARVRGAAEVLDAMGQALIGASFGPLDEAENLAQLVATCRERRCVMVWDDVDAVSAHDPALVRFVEKLRGCPSKVILTSRDRADWLGRANRFALALDPLPPGERYELCAALLRDLGLPFDRRDDELRRLIRLLGGHPLAMRIVIPELESRPPEDLCSRLCAAQNSLTGQTAAVTRVQPEAVMRFVERELLGDAAPLLALLAPDGESVDSDSLLQRARSHSDRWSRAHVERLLQTLTDAGLLQRRDNSVYEFHPLVGRYVQAARGTSS